MVAARKGNVEEAWDMIVDESPQKAIMRGCEIKRNLQLLMPVQEYVSPEGLMEWKLPANLLGVWEKVRGQKTLVLIGPPGTGKTYWARSLGRHHFVSHMDQLRGVKMNPEEEYLCFDDMSFGHLPRESVIHLVDSDQPRNIHCRYGVVQIPARMGKIIVSNRTRRS